MVFCIAGIFNCSHILLIFFKRENEDHKSLNFFKKKNQNKTLVLFKTSTRKIEEGGSVDLSSRPAGLQTEPGLQNFTI